MSHDNFQPPEFDAPEMDDDDRMHGALSDLASIDTSDVNLRDQPAAYEILDRLMQHAYAEGRKDAVEAAEADRGLSVVGTVVRHYPGGAVSMSTLVPPDELVHGMQLLAYRR